ncbi:GLUG motif-containing protein [Nanoarchaeota archaeon]
MDKKGAFKASFLIVALLVIVLLVNYVFALAGTGTSGDPFQITNCTDLNETRNNLTAYYVLTNDVNCSDTVNWDSGKGFDPIGTMTDFEGHLDGQNHIVHDLFIKDQFVSGSALFSNIEAGSVRNLGLVNVDITSVGYPCTASLVGYLDFYSVIDNVYATGSVNGSSLTGGLVGSSSSRSNITNSHANVTVISDSSEVGGLAGYSYAYGIIDNCYATGDVTGSSSVGGLVGELKDYAIVNDSYATGTVTGSSGAVGGLVGII